MASPDAEAVYVIDINDMKSVFKFQTDASNVNLLDVSSSNTSLRYYVDSSAWPSFNVANSMMDHVASVDPIASGYQTDKMMVTHDFMRHLAKGVFNTHHGVDLFNNEKDINAPVFPNDRIASASLSFTDFTASDMLEFAFDLITSDGVSSIETNSSQFIILVT